MRPGRARKRAGWVVGLGLLVSIIWLARPDPAPPTPHPDFAVKVTTVIAQRRVIAQQLLYSGPVVGRQEIPVYADLPQGRISKVLVKPGQQVKTGALLATVDNALLRVQQMQQQAQLAHAGAAIAQQETQLAEAQAQYAQAQAERQRGDVVAKTGFISREVAEQRASVERVAGIHVEAARDSLKMARTDKALIDAQLAETALHLERSKLRAPVAGIVTERHATVGLSLAQLSDPLFVIIANDVLEVALDVSADDAARLTVGTAASIRVDGTDTPLAGRVRLGAAEIRRRDQTASVRVAFDSSPRLIPGQFVQVALAVSSRDAIYLPKKAVSFDGTVASVFTVRDGHAVRIPVRVGEHNKGLVELISGVTEGEPVIDSFTAFLRDGEPVSVTANSATRVFPLPSLQPFLLKLERSLRFDSSPLARPLPP